MELCVLIPDELSLTVNNVIPKIDKAMCTIVSNMRITKGTRFKPMQGTIRYVKVNLTVILLDCFFFLLFCLWFQSYHHINVMFALDFIER